VGGVASIIRYYKGKISVYVLDDGARKEVKDLAREFSFEYEVRANRGQFKKAGNLRHGFDVSNGEFIVIFDADFKPREDFLDELLPYMFDNDRIGIVQSPQYFDVHTEQNWLERGAGAVQELFYRFSQVSRQNHGAAICVGSNAVYRRKALESTGGTALIEHSEDVHTGFNLRIHNWQLTYVPVLLAKGLCPESMPAFFKQQYRWCMGSMSLLSSEKFWSTKLAFRTRLSYISGFLYYIHTAISSFFAPIVPLILLIAIPESVEFKYTLFILPAFFFAWVVYPLWHKNIYGIEAWAVRSVYGWAHLFAIYDAITRRAMSWQPTGAVKGRDYRYLTFRVMQLTFNLLPALAWVALSGWYLFAQNNIAFSLIFISGLLYLSISLKVALYTKRYIGLSSIDVRPIIKLKRFSFWLTNSE
jgi:cellulose synthase (UDP-forming)